MAQADGTVIIDTELNTDGFDAGAQDIEEAFRRMSEKLGTGEMDFGSKEIEETLRATADSLDGLGEKAKIALQKQIDSFANLNNQYEQQKQKVDELKQKMQEIGEQQIPTEAYTALENQLQELYDEYDRVEAKKEEFAGLGFSAEQLENAYAGIDRELEEISAEMGRVIDKQDEMTQNGTAFTMGYDTEQYAQMMNKLTTEEMKLENMNNRLNTSFATIKNNIEGYQSQLSATASAAGETASETRQMGNNMSSTGTKASHATTGMNRFGNSCSNVLTSIKSLASNLPIVGRLFSSLGSTGSNAISGITSRLKVGVGQLVAYTVGVRSVYSAVQKITSAVKEGFTNLREYSSELDRALTSVQNSLTTVKNALAAAFEPIVTAVAPYISKFCNMIATALNYVSAFFSVLTGKSTYTKAVSSTSSAVSTLSASVGDAADEFSEYSDVADDAANAVQTYETAVDDAESAVEDYLSPLDELNKLQEEVADSASSGSGSGSGSGSSGSGSGSGSGSDTGSYGSGASSPSFVEEEIGDNVVDWANKFLEMWEEADFTELGNILGEKLRDALDSIDWESIQEGAAKVAKSLATLINGFVETEGLDESIGRTIGEAINTGLTFVDTFLEETHFQSIGEFISGSICSALGTVDWSLAGHTISEGLIAGMDLVSGLIKGVDWRNLPSALWEGAKDFIQGFNWDDFSYSLGNLLGNVTHAAVELTIGIKDVVVEYAENVKERYQTNLEEFAEKAGIDPSEVSAVMKVSFAFEAVTEPVADWFEPVLDGIASGFYDAWYGKGAWDALKASIDDSFSGLAPELEEAGMSDGAAVVTGLEDAFADSGPITKLAARIVELLGIGMANKNAEIEEIGTDTSKTLANGISSGSALSAFQNAGSTLSGWAESIFGGKLKGTFSNIWELIKSDASFVWDGIKGTLSTVWEAIKNNGTTIFGNLKDTVSNVWEQTKTIASNAWDGIKTTLSNAWDGLKNAASTAFNAVKDAISTVWNGIKSAASTAWNGIKTALSTAWDGIKSAASTAFNAVKDAISTVWDGIKTAASTAWDGIKTTLSNAWDGLKNVASTAFNAVKDTISNVWDNVKSAASTAWDGIKTTLSNAWDSIKSTASNAWSKIKTTITNVWDNLKSTASTAFNNIKTTISNVWNNVKSEASSAWTNIKSTISNAWENLKSGASSAFSTIKSTISNAWSNISSNTSSAWSTIKSTVSSAWETVKSTISTAGSNIVSNVSSAFSNVASNIKSWLSTANSNASSAMSTLKSTITNAGNAISNLNWHTIGSNIVSGIKNGISNTASTLYNSMVSLAKNALGVAKKALGISSPSRVFRDAVGKMIPAGISVGLEKGFPKTYRTLANMTDGLMAAVPTSMAVPKVSLPRLAEGGVIPPRTVFAAVLGDQNVGNNIEAPEALLRKIVREESAKNQPQPTNNSYEFTAQINRRTLFDEMITEAQIRLGVSGKNPFEIA